MSKYVFVSSNIVSTGVLNQYRMSVSLSTSSSAVYNNYGINVYAVIGSSSVHLGTPTITAGAFSTSDYSYTFSVSSNTSVSARCICSWCENGNHNVYYSEFNNASTAQTASYTNPAIIPYAPNPTKTWADGTTCTSQYNDTVYKGTVGGNKDVLNSTRFDCGMPGNSTSVVLYLEKYVSPNWQLINTGYPVINYTYKSSDREFLFRLRSVSHSSTGHTTWGTPSEWRINDLPVMNGNNVSTNVSRTTNSVTVSWSPLSDGLNKDNSKFYRIHLDKFNGSSYVDHRTISLGDVNSHTFNLSDYGFNQGDRCRIFVEPGDYLEWSFVKYGGRDVVRNSPPYFSSGTIVNTSVDSNVYNKVFKDDITISWNTATDAEKDTLTYYVYYKAQNDNGSWQADWTNIKTTTDKYTGVSCQNYVSRGRQIQIAIGVTDGLESGSLITSAVLTRDNFPSAPTNIMINPNQTEEHYESIQSVSWTKSIGTNGKDCSNYVVDMIICKTKNVNDVYSTVTKTTTGTYIDSFDLSSIQRGYYIYFRIKAIDMYGLESISYLQSKWCRKNKAPYAPTNFKINSSKLNLYMSAPLKWDAASDPDGDNITYSILCSYNRGSYSSIATGLTGTTYSHNISNRQPKETIGYKIITIDKHGVPSTEAIIENNHNIVINSKPNPAVLIYPISLVYDKTPRILLQTNGDIDGDDLSIKISINGQDFNSATSSAFDKSSYGCNKDKIIFIPPALNSGVNTFKIMTNDGYENSTESTFTINYTQALLNVISDTADILITPSVYDKLTKMISDTRAAYGHPLYNPNGVVATETYITSYSFNELYTKIAEVNSWINTNYPGKIRIKYKPLIAKGSLISKNIHNQILEIITNI